MHAVLSRTQIGICCLKGPGKSALSAVLAQLNDVRISQQTRQRHKYRVNPWVEPPWHPNRKKPQYLWDYGHLEEITEGKYTHKPLNVRKLGGRNPETGRKVNNRIGGGIKWDYFMVDKHRTGPSEGFYEEKILEIKNDPNRTCKIALVAGSRGKRWLLAEQTMKPGQIIRSTSYIPPYPAPVKPGDAHPLGAIPVGTSINSIEPYPGHGHQFVVNGGGEAVVLKRQDDKVIVKMRNKHEYAFKAGCMATIGKLSMADHHHKLTCAVDARRRGRVPYSGPKYRKSGYCGRKVRPLPSVRHFDEPAAPEGENVKLTLTKQDLSALFGPGRINTMRH